MIKQPGMKTPHASHDLIHQYPNHPSLEIKNAEQALKYIEEQQIQYIKIGLFDKNATLRSKYISKGKFIKGLENGLGFCNVIMSSDFDDKICDTLSFTGWHTGFPDSNIRIIPESCRQIPFEPHTLLFLTEFSEENAQLCPRNLLKKVIVRANEMGFNPYAALEYEFSVFNETSQSIHDKNFRNLNPITPGNFGYSTLRNTVYAEFYNELLQTCEMMDFNLEGLHTEIGPGVLEAAIAYDTGLAAADKAALFKTFAKIIAQRYGWLATFMAKWNINQQGQSGHTHISLRTMDNKYVFYDENETYHMSKTMRQFLAGQQKYLPDLLALSTPTINSFARLVPDYWAPTQASWGVDNRTCALRVIGGSPTSQRIEYRVPGADTNPYFTIMAALASGLWGIEQKLELQEPIQGNAYTQAMPKQYQFSKNLWDATQRLKQCELAREWFGEQFIQDYAASREWEVNEYERQVTGWQLERYLESA